MKQTELNVDFSNVIGSIKPMHAINNVPTVPNDFYGLYDAMQRAAIPYARLHDTGGRYGGTHYVDVENIFPNFDADENDPASYDFAFTDALLSSMMERGLKPFYRLGATIENYHYIRPYHIYPPKDPEKWARICEHIIRHYNEKWANGYEMGIEYWEIWNEPDNEPEIAANPMWKGTKEKFFELYRAAYTHLKACFPSLKIGGYASCGFYALSSADFSHVANSSPRTEYFVEFFLDFLAFIRENGVGLDFFSWHSYAGDGDNVAYAQYVREKLNEFGFVDCEVFLNEWNPGTHNRGLQQDASEILTMMCRMHETPTDMCMYYDANIQSGYCGLFDPVRHGLFPAYYAFLMFGNLYRLKNQVSCQIAGDANNIYALAARDDQKRGVVVVNHTGEEKTVRLNTADAFHLRRVDKAHSYDEDVLLSEQESFTLGAHGIAWLSAE